MGDVNLPEMGSTSELLADWAFHRMAKPEPFGPAAPPHVHMEMDAWVAKDAAFKLIIGDAMAEKTVASIIERFAATGGL